MKATDCCSQYSCGVLLSSGNFTGLAAPFCQLYISALFAYLRAPLSVPSLQPIHKRHFHCYATKAPSSLAMPLLLQQQQNPTTIRKLDLRTDTKKTAAERTGVPASYLGLLLCCQDRVLCIGIGVAHTVANVLHVQTCISAKLSGTTALPSKHKQRGRDTLHLTQTAEYQGDIRSANISGWLTVLAPYCIQYHAQ